MCFPGTKCSLKNKSSKFCNIFSNSSLYVNAICWHLVSITLFKSNFYFLEFNITDMFRPIYFFCLSIINDSSGVIFPVLKYFNSCVPKSTMDSVNHLKGPSSVLMTWFDNFRFNHNSVKKFFLRIKSYLPLAKSSTWHFYVTTFVAITSGRLNSTSTLMLVVILTAYMCHCITSCFKRYFF